MSVPRPPHPPFQESPRMTPIAVDYQRFSDKIQERGNSLERQRGLADAWEERTKIPIDRTIALVDEGVSAFKLRSLKEIEGMSPDQFALSRFLEMVKSGRLLPGDYLLIENLDRLSRDEEVPATHLLTSILMTGLKVVQLAPYELELTRKSDAFTIFRAVLEMSRGHGESKAKQFRIKASWESRRAAAAKGRQWRRKKDDRMTNNLQGRLPGWIDEGPDGSLCLNPEKTAIVQEIYRLARTGLGAKRIRTELIKQGVPPFGSRVPNLAPDGSQLRDRMGRLRWKRAPGVRYGTGRWSSGIINLLLADPRAKGEFYPRNEGTQTGELVRIPAAVQEDEWLDVQGKREERKRFPGRHGGTIENLWQGMLTDAITEASYHSIARRGNGDSPQQRQGRAYVNGDARGEGKRPSFPADAFDRGILALLREVNPAEVLGRPGPDQVSILSARLEDVRRRRLKLEAELAAGSPPSNTVLRLLAGWEAEEAALEEQRRQAAQEAASPLSEAWGQTLSCLDLIETREQRLRLRTLLRRIVEDVRLVVVGLNNFDRLAAVQVHFRGGDQPRHYLIFHQPPLCRRPPKTVALTFRDAHGLDLRRRDDAVAIREQLETMDRSIFHRLEPV